MAAQPFDDSRRLTGPNLYFDGPGAALETILDAGIDDALIDAWRQRVLRALSHLRWPHGPILARRHASGASLTFAAPADRLYAATEVNEWAWQAALRAAGRNDFEVALAPGHAPPDDETAALAVLARVAAAEACPRLQPLLDAAAGHGVLALLDEDALSLGSGRGGRTWPIDSLPDPEQVPWPELHDIPIALVTGSNGKTTTVRLLAAISSAHGWRSAHSCTDGLYVAGELLEGGDYSGPGGARTLLRRTDIDAAILETARGGLLRRGLAVSRSPVAVVTNVSADHYGEYGIHGLDDLAQVKLSVARAIDREGTLVLNADDARLVAGAERLHCPLAWFGLDAELPRLRQSRADRGRSCALRDGRLVLFDGEREHDLGAVAEMPLSLGGSAEYNIANAAAAALAAHTLGIDTATIARVLAQFGGRRDDNPGRLQHWSLPALEVYVDYAHNPDGLSGLLAVASRQRRGRLALVLGQAGNRDDAQIRELAAAAARFRPDLVVLKDMDGYLRGRAGGEVAGILRAALIEHGMATDHLFECLDELEAARHCLAWARAGDVLVLPIHNIEARAGVCTLLNRLESEHWQPGQPLPLG